MATSNLLRNSQASTEEIQFLSFIAVEKGLSKNTISAYMRHIREFLNYLPVSGKGDFKAAIRRDVMDYVAYCAVEVGGEAIANRISALRQFYRFMAREGIVPYDITEAVESPRLQRKLPNVLSEKDTVRLMKAYKLNSRSPEEFRNRAILELIYSSGLRASEVISLHPENIDFKEEILKVIGKGGKERIVPVGKPALRILAKYLEKVRPRLIKKYSTETPVLFVSYRGNPLDREAIWKIVKKAAGIAGISKNVYPHTLRHSFATHLLENGANIRMIQEMLGHSSIDTTMIYTHVDSKKLLRIHRQFFPRAKRKAKGGEYGF
ncbi:MAG: site-specific tyrosine recombinase XerD [Victivallales bacterium]